jgi:hypothetical protein
MSRFTKRHASALPGVPTVGRAFAGGPTQAHPGGNTVAAKTRRTSGRGFVPVASLRRRDIPIWQGFALALAEAFSWRRLLAEPRVSR